MVMKPWDVPLRPAGKLYCIRCVKYSGVKYRIHAELLQEALGTWPLIQVTGLVSPYQ